MILIEVGLVCLMTLLLFFGFDRLVHFFEVDGFNLRGILKTAFIDNITNSYECKKKAAKSVVFFAEE